MKFETKVHKIEKYYQKRFIKQAGAKLGQAQLKLEMELCSFWFKICCIKLINKKN